MYAEGSIMDVIESSAGYIAGVKRFMKVAKNIWREEKWMLSYVHANHVPMLYVLEKSELYNLT